MYQRVFIVICLAVFAQSETPDIYWSMDTWNGSVITPDIGDPTILYLPVSSDNVGIGQGVSGDALRLDNARVWVGDSGSSNWLEQKGYSRLGDLCFSKPSSCKGGLSVGMWMKVEIRSTPIFCIFTTTPLCNERYLSGIAIKKDNDEVSAYVSLSNGSYFQASVSSSFIRLEEWHHFAFTWDFATGIKLYINGSEVTTYTKNPFHANQRMRNINASLMMFGDHIYQESLLLDDVKLWSRPVSEDFLITSSPLSTATASTDAYTSLYAGVSTANANRETTTPEDNARERTSSKQISQTSTMPVESYHVSTMANELGEGYSTSSEVISTVAVPQNPSGVWLWLLIGFCVLVLLEIALMVLLLYKRGIRRHRDHGAVSGTEMMTPVTSNSVFSSRQPTNAGSVTAELLGH